MELKTGLKYTSELTVGPEHTAKTFASGLLEVFATPMLAALMEKAAMMAVSPALKDGQGTVGTRLELDHLAATPVGGHVRATAELISIDRRRLTFRIEAFDDTEKIGECTHDRFIIDNKKFMEKASAKCL